MAGKLKADLGAQAMPEESEGLVQVRLDGQRQGLHERFHPGERWLFQPALPARHLDWTDFHIAGHVARPRSKNRRGPSRIWKTKQTQSRLWIRQWTDNPGVCRRCVLGHKRIVADFGILASDWIKFQDKRLVRKEIQM
jgi:hypothetical protein